MEVEIALDTDQAQRLAQTLRDLRKLTWPDHVLTQRQLAKVFSTEEPGSVAGATLSSWESTAKPKRPSPLRLSAYARFFCTRRSLAGEPHLIPEDQLEPDELDRFRRLESELLELLHPEDHRARRPFEFDVGPLIVICPDAPTEVQGSLAHEDDPNFTKLQKYADLDALIELYGHLRAENPALDVFHRLASEVRNDDLSTHVIVLGGIGWNEVTLTIQSAITQVPITQTAVDDLKDGDIFRVETPNGIKSFYPEYKELGKVKKLVADVGFLARLRNPFKVSRTLTICNGIFSHGVYGAVRCLTDSKVRDENEKYLANRFPDGEFAMLLRIPVVKNETVSPDLQNPDTRRYEWAPNQDTQ